MPFRWPDAYRPAVVAPQPHPGDAVWFVFRGTELLVRDLIGAPGEALLPMGGHPGMGDAPVLRTQYLGELHGRHAFAAEADAGADAPPGWAWSGLRSMFGVLDDAQLALAGRALQLVDWDRTHQFCGACGTRTEPSTTERSRRCPACSLSVYPRLAPAVMCLLRRSVSDDPREDQLLLARSPRFPKGMYSALAGFVEPGETLEDCVRREVFEEVGLKVGRLRYFASQPWPFPHSLMIAFFGDYESGEITIDGVEIEAAQWFSAGNLPPLPAKISIARNLIDAAMGEMQAAPSR